MKEDLKRLKLRLNWFLINMDKGASQDEFEEFIAIADYVDCCSDF